jgi:hypothetical protein
MIMDLNSRYQPDYLRDAADRTLGSFNTIDPTVFSPRHEFPLLHAGRARNKGGRCQSKAA